FDVFTLVKYGAIFPPLVIEFNEYYRLVTAMFLHGSLIHFLSNSFVLYFLGSHLERLIGPMKFTILYFVSGIGSSVFVIFLGSENAVTIGASGAIFGIMGSLLILTFMRKKWFTQGSIRSLRQLMVINLVLTFAIPNISIPGHLGGLIFGSGLIFLLTPQKPYFIKLIHHLRQTQIIIDE
ncbi:MAG: rhomboid family intramembrane serine protease, partial [Acholeplasmataceae bacterium]|nr:rhomboid family intramembrane serine protease [Acholeplasmataceae bacterium]